MENAPPPRHRPDEHRALIVAMGIGLLVAGIVAFAVRSGPPPAGGRSMVVWIVAALAVLAVLAAAAGPLARRSRSRRRPRWPTPPDATDGGHVCPRCGRALPPGADVSPSGDVRCTTCGAWTNVDAR